MDGATRATKRGLLLTRTAPAARLANPSNQLASSICRRCTSSLSRSPSKAWSSVSNHSYFARQKRRSTSRLSPSRVIVTVLGRTLHIHSSRLRRRRGNKSTARIHCGGLGPSRRRKAPARLIGGYIGCLYCFAVPELDLSVPCGSSRVLLRIQVTERSVVGGAPFRTSALHNLQMCKRPVTRPFSSTTPHWTLIPASSPRPPRRALPSRL